MNKLTKNDILDLNPSDEYYYVYLGKLSPNGVVIEWGGRSRIHIQRSVNKKGESKISCITTKDYEWAEGSYRDIFDDGVYVEDYVMFIYSLD